MPHRIAAAKNCVDIDAASKNITYRSVNGLMKNCCCRSISFNIVAAIGEPWYGRDGNFLGFPFSSQTQSTVNTIFMSREMKMILLHKRSNSLTDVCGSIFNHKLCKKKNGKLLLCLCINLRKKLENFLKLFFPQGDVVWSEKLREITRSWIKWMFRWMRIKASWWKSLLI